jgi:putative endopeptidase
MAVTLRRSVFSPFTLLVVFGAAACQPGDAAPAKSASAATPLVDESKLPKLPRFDVSDLDSTKSVCQDLDAYVNGKWLAQNPVPADKTTWGTFELLDERYK